ncbi:hypothetical protein BMS3Abin15_00192 [bacterium BMS3Abin15]|nr:hypothetical protein BMS3Abin15_00192 [bacterium BMS3Abin15]
MMATSCTLGLMCNKEAIISHSAFSANTCEVPDAPVAIVESEKTTASLDFPIIVSDYLEKYATDAQRKQGLDIADFL